MKKPNFFIVGAPKCGTTALYTYLASHRNIFLPELKEPHFFSDDLPNMRAIDSEEAYLSLFNGTTDEHIAVGEGSVMYLYSQVAIKRIHEFNPDARLIVMLRNPFEMIHSFHSQLCYGFQETEKNLARAWSLQESRRNGMNLPARPTDLSLLQYKAVGELGRQVEALLNYFPAEQVKLILFDDLKASPASVYEEALAFLGVPSDGRTDFPRVNSNRVNRSPFLAQLLIALLNLQRKIKRLIGLGPNSNKTVLRYFNILSCLRKLNTNVKPRSSPPEALRQQILGEFRSDIERLSVILGKDLSHWLK
ncbi:MAG: sulfotransferase family protein [Endozoicomonas sp.]